MAVTLSKATLNPVQDYLASLHQHYVGNNEGALADYIPELALANPDWFGICLVTVDGNVYEVGDSRQTFTIQSISKPFSYGIALEDNGRLPVLAKVGVEPTGDSFNSISLDPATGQPCNPMINAGAIATTGLVDGTGTKQKLYRIRDAFSRYAGRELEVDENVYRSESETGHRNRAISHLLKNFEIVGDPEIALEAYFQQCSLLVNCRDLATMAATLANGGVNPLSSKRAVDAHYVPSILSVMGSCGMYDYAGEWIYNIGMPAKSGVAGGIVAVLPGKLGIGVFSPLLDPRGNSVRGIKVCEELSHQFNLHLFRSSTDIRSVIRTKYSANQISSRRSRIEKERVRLEVAGSRIGVWQLQGPLDFSTVEVVIRDLFDSFNDQDFFVIDVERVLTVDRAACELLVQSCERLRGAGKHLFLTHFHGHPILRRIFRSNLSATQTELTFRFHDTDIALEWSENCVLALTGDDLSDTTLPLEQSELFVEFTDEQMRVISSHLITRSYERGDEIIKIGDPGEEIFILEEGKASVTLRLPNGEEKRVITYIPGMLFGEISFIDGGIRSASVVAEEPTVCKVLSRSSLNDLESEVRIAILERLASLFASKIRKVNQEVSILDRKLIAS